MPTLNPASALSEWTFTKEEYNSARTLTQSQICLLQTKYAQLFKQRGSIPIPNEIALDRDYICQLAELDGKMAIIQEQLDDHVAVVKEMNDPANKTPEAAGESINLDAAARAARFVNVQN